MKKKIFIIYFFIILSFCFFSSDARAAEDTRVEVPSTIEGAKQKVMDLIRVAGQEMPKSVKAMWQEEVIPVWTRMYDWYKENIWARVQTNIKTREPAVKEAFDKEKGEMAEDIKKEAPKISEYLKFLWQEFKNLFQIN